MEKYHIYDEIGKGDFSQVFKGREKKKIEYVAIKRVDKSVMSKIVNEVQTMHKLESPHTVRFHDWYETKNNLWLILEYCTGSDLRSLLLQDGHLPETSVRLFAVDIMAAIAYLHSNGMIHCDIRPANMLIDEYGILKLSDFKFVRKIPKVPDGPDNMLAQQVPAAAFGYMAPECLSLSAVPSFASDLWSVGCVLFQLRRGYMPFGSVEPETGVKSGASASRHMYSAIQRTQHVFSRPDPSLRIPVDYDKVPAVTAVFADLVSWLLDSDPLQRMTWSDAPSHPFWAPKVCSRPTNLPSQPAFEAYLKRLEELEAAREAHQYEAKRDGAGKSIIDVPVIASQSSQASQQSPSPVPSTVSIVAASPAKTVPATPSRVDRETATVAASAGSLLMCAHDSQVRPIVNNRAIEVIERPPFKASALPCAPITIQQVSGMLPTELEAHLTKIYKALHKAMAGCVANCEVVAGPASAAQAQQQQVQIYADKMGSLLGYLCSLAPSPDIANVVMNTQFLKVLLRILLLVVSRYRHVQSAALAGTPNSRIPGHSPVGKPSTVGRPSAVSAVQLAISATVTESACLAATVLALMLRHATFVQTVQSTKTDNEIGTPDKRSRFASSPSSPSGQQSAGLDGTHVDSPNIVNALINTMHVVDAEISAGYGMASSGTITPSKQPVSSVNRTTRSPGSVAATSVAGALDGVLRLKLRLMAALGELAFYVSAQDSAPTDIGRVAPAWNFPADVWNILVGAVNSPTVVISGGGATRSGGRSADEIAEITKHYATKTIENILTTDGGDILFSSTVEERSHLLSSPASRVPPLPQQLPGLVLLDTSQKSNYEPLQVSSAMAFCHLLRYLCQTVAQSSRGGARLQLQTLSRMVQSDPDGNTLLLCVHGLKDATVKLQHAYLNIIAILLHYATCDDTAGPGAAIVNKTLEVWRVLLCDGRTPVLAVICALLEQSSSAVVRAKAVLCIQLLDSSCRAAGSNRVLRSLGDNRRFISAVSRCLEAAEGADGSFSHNASLLASPAGQKEGQSTTQQYLAQCARSFGGHVQRVLLQALERVGGDLGQATEALWVQEGHGPSVLSQHLHRGLLDARKCTEGIMHSFDTVRACVALSSSPQMLRLVLSEETVLKAGGRLISAVKPIQLAFQQFSRLWKQSNGESAGSAYTSAPFVAFADILGSAEQVAVSVLEGVAQMEMQLEEQVAGEGALAVYGALLDIVPSALKLIAEPSSGDIRVLVSVCLRRLLPSLISAVSSLFPAQVLHVALDHINRRKVQVSSTAMGLAMGVLVCVTETIRWLPHLLSDKAPVPQYAVRLAADLSLTSYPVALIIGHEIEMDFVDCGCGLVTGRGATVMLEHLPRRRPLLIEIISRMLPSVAAAMYCSSSTFADLSEDDDHSSSTDPQAGALIRMLIEKASTSASTEFFSQLQAQGQRGPAGGALVVTATSDSFMATLLSGGLCWALREAIAWAIIQSNMDHLSILLDLLQHYLEHIIARTGSDNDADRSITEFLSQRNTAAEYFAPLAAWMAAVASCISGSCRLRQRASESSSVGRNWSMLSRGFTPDSSTALDPVQDSSVYHVVLDGCVVCLTLLSELSPAHFIKMLAVARSSEGISFSGRLVCMDAGTHDVSSISPDNLPPLCTSSVTDTLSSTTADIKVRIRYMKMLIACCKTCASFGGLETELRDAFMRPEAELRLAVARCSKEVYSGAGGIEKEGEKAIYVSFQRLAANFLMFLDNVPEQQPYY